MINEPLIYYGFFHNSCIYESAAALISLHRTKAGAYRAMVKYQFDAWVSVNEPLNIRGFKRDKGKRRKAFVYERSHISIVEIKD